MFTNKVREQLSPYT